MIRQLVFFMVSNVNVIGCFLFTPAGVLFLLDPKGSLVVDDR